MITLGQNKSLVSTLNVTITALNHSLAGRDDILVTTSYGFQSALLFFLMQEAGVNAEYLYISSALAQGGIEQHRELINDIFQLEVDVVNRDDWLETQLRGRDFLDVAPSDRMRICSELKRKPLLEYAQQKKSRIWVTGIRRDQTDKRNSVKFVNGTDMEMIKIAPIFNWGGEEVDKILKYCNLPVNRMYADLCKMNASGECGLHNL